MAGHNILLIEPGYKNKYPPLGLMKIAQYHGPRGKNDRVRFIKGEDPSVLEESWDRVYVTTLFSFEFGRIGQSIDYALKVVNGQSERVFVGGIAASLMQERFLDEPRWHGVRFIKGLLSQPPAVALDLDAFSGDFYADDVDGTPIEDLVPDYDILSQVDYDYPVKDAYFAYTSRGCIRKCHFCGVPKLEGGQRDVESLSAMIAEIDRLYGPKKDLVLMDNNVVASGRFKDIMAEIRDLGFVPGATLTRPGMLDDLLEEMMGSKALEPLDPSAAATLARIERLDISTYNEIEVRSEIIDPLSAAIELGKGSSHRGRASHEGAK